MKERILIVDNRGRGHALGWKLKVADGSRELFFAPGNYGTSKLGVNVDIDITEIDRLERFASDNEITLTVVGPEVALEKGIVNSFRKDNLAIFGPTQKAAILETSKSRAIEFMQRHNIPHPESKIFDNINEALSFVENPTWAEIVVKAYGLAAGKGVILPDSIDRAKQAIKRIMIGKEFDDGKEVIIQKRLRGKEVSLICITDGKTIVPLLPVRDYKRIDDEDKGPNTGGMGAFAPVPEVSKKLLEEIYNTILIPTIRGMEDEGKLYQGVLYAGLMLTEDGPKVLEYNSRFGDPETQVLMMLLKSDLYPALKNAAEGRLRKKDIVFRKGASVCVVLAAEGYPGRPKIGDVVHGLDTIDNPFVQIFDSGMIVRNGQIETNGGRVLAVTAYGKDIEDARRQVYGSIGQKGIIFRGAQYRSNVGKGVQRLRQRRG